ncbi:DUF982 domain-containing protein [Mesorhizobium sp. LjRoot246]|uniref:DUF982 domain-containing protein n=1 Tax=Mesorhizobium sp. LjRoot246 TaxID=3342294 RepID=UPI003F4F91DE
MGASTIPFSSRTIVQEITCLDDALDFLDEWPIHRRGPIFDTARRACHRAFDGCCRGRLPEKPSPHGQDRRASWRMRRFCPG